MRAGRARVGDSAAKLRSESVKLMQDRFIGDIGDFAKYGLLRALAGVHPQEAPELSLGVVWYRVPDSNINYLNDPQGPGNCDPPLFGELKRLVGSNQRTIAAIEQAPIWPRGTNFFRLQAVKRVPSAESDPWLDAAVNEVGKCKLVFLDPDNEKRGIVGGTAVEANPGGWHDRRASQGYGSFSLPHHGWWWLRFVPLSAGGLRGYGGAGIGRNRCHGALHRGRAGSVRNLDRSGLASSPTGKLGYADHAGDLCPEALRLAGATGGV
ncbi:hypothetical protein SBV1_3080002 [Verrucomicrobia bacterium]|nr:hypothetical protein SBV1_3080002 [Verrucomicrobiota bacterium]